MFRSQVTQSVPVFQCDFICMNCGHTWEVQFSRGWGIFQEEDKGKAWVNVLDPRKKSHPIECPNCLSNQLRVIERCPLIAKPIEPVQAAQPQQIVQPVAQPEPQTEFIKKKPGRARK